MIYVYGCKEHKDVRVQVSHSMMSKVIVFCPVCKCNRHMHRIPQRTRFYINPGEVLLDRLDTQYREYRARKR